MSSVELDVKQDPPDAPSPSLYESYGRIAQKRRTRATIKSAAAALLANDPPASMGEIARRAGVSRSSAYRYFPTVEALVAEVALDAVVAPDIASIDAAAASSGRPERRLAAVIRTDHQVVARHDATFRGALRTMVGAEPAGDRLPRRPGNRLRYLGTAIEDVQDQIPAEAFTRLLAALALTVGIESRIVLTDIVGLDDTEAEHVKQWAAATLLRAAMTSTDGTNASPSPA
jgi:AcrR family transcriptional regulator